MRFRRWFEAREIKQSMLRDHQRLHRAGKILDLGMSPLLLNNLQFKKNSKYVLVGQVLRSNRKPGLCKVSLETNSLGL